MIREYKPAGFDSWHKYYEAEGAAVKRREDLKESIVTACYILGIAAIVFGMLWLGILLDFISQH